MDGRAVADHSRDGAQGLRQVEAAAGDHRGNEPGNRGRRDAYRPARAAAVIGLDSNVLVRYLTQDDPVQSAAATEIVERRLTAEEPGFISIVTMVETVSVLDRAYGVPFRDIAACVERLCQAGTVVIENEPDVFTAMLALKAGRGSFSDALAAALGARAGCRFTLTFDRDALRLPGFVAA